MTDRDPMHHMLRAAERYRAYELRQQRRAFALVLLAVTAVYAVSLLALFGGSCR